MPGAGEPALHPSQPGAATLLVQWAPYPGPLSWQPALSQAPGHLDHPPKLQLPQAKSAAVLAPVQAPSLQWGAPPPCPPLCPPLLYLPTEAPLWASTPPTPAPHPSLELTRYAHLPGIHWSCTPQEKPSLCTSAYHTLRNLGTSSLACCLGMAQI